MLLGLGHGPALSRLLQLGGCSPYGDLQWRFAIPFARVCNHVLVRYRVLCVFCMLFLVSFAVAVRRYSMGGFMSFVLICHWWRRGDFAHSIIVDRRIFSCYFDFCHGCSDGAFSMFSREMSSAVVLFWVLYIVFWRRRLRSKRAY